MPLEGGFKRNVNEKDKSENIGKLYEIPGHLPGNTFEGYKLGWTARSKTLLIIGCFRSEDKQPTPCTNAEPGQTH